MYKYMIICVVLFASLACRPEPPPAEEPCYDACQRQLMAADVTQEQADANCRQRCGLPPASAAPTSAP